MRLGAFSIDVVSDGSFWLDAGTMFGVAPKALWERLAPVDERNRMEIGLNALLVRSPNYCALIEAGMGRDYDEKLLDIYRLRPRPTLLEALDEKGVEPEDVDLVVLTHLHLDHAGWCTQHTECGEYVPTFPRARYVVQADELDDARRPCELTKGSYVAAQFEPLLAADRLDTVQGDVEVAPGLSVRLTGGHCRGHQVVCLESEGRRLVFLGDVAPTAFHLRLTYCTAYDTFPLDLLAAKKALFAQAEAEQWIVAFPHELQQPLARITRDAKGRYAAAAL